MAGAFSVYSRNQVKAHKIKGCFRKAPSRQAAGGGGRGSPSGEELEGESPRGGD